MKKTLVALMALAGVVTAADAITLGSYYTFDGVNYDAVDNFYGQTKDEILAKSTGLTVDKIAFNAYSIDDLNPMSLDTGAMLSSDSTLTSGTELELSSLSMLARADDMYQGLGSTVSITIDDVTYTSDVATFSDGGNGHGLITYTFVEDLPTFELGDVLTFSFTLADGYIEYENMIPVAAFRGLSAAPTVFNGGWQAAMQLKVEAVTNVPEPTTATLSLLALAGLAMRRRRK